MFTEWSMLVRSCISSTYQQILHINRISTETHTGIVTTAKERHTTLLPSLNKGSSLSSWNYLEPLLGSSADSQLASDYQDAIRVYPPGPLLFSLYMGPGCVSCSSALTPHSTLVGRQRAEPSRANQQLDGPFGLHPPPGDWATFRASIKGQLGGEREDEELGSRLTWQS
jgi:hypothetical protein